MSLRWLTLGALVGGASTAFWVWGERQRNEALVRAFGSISGGPTGAPPLGGPSSYPNMTALQLQTNRLLVAAAERLFSLTEETPRAPQSSSSK